MKLSKISGLVTLVWLIFVTGANAQKKTYESWDVPSQHGLFVHDEAGLLSPETVQELEQRLKNFAESTHHEVAVLTLYDLNGGADTYARKVIYEWKLGKKEKDGALLLIVEKQHEMRIEVGNGLIDQLTSSECEDIIATEIVPAFKDQDYNKGTTAAVTAMLAGIEGVYAAPEDKFAFLDPYLGMIYALIIFASVFGLLSRRYWIAFYVVLLLLCAGTVGLKVGWSWVIAFAVGFPLLRLFVVKSKMWQWDFGKNSNDGNDELDESDRMQQRNAIFGSSSSDSSDSSSSNSDDSGASGRW